MRRSYKGRKNPNALSEEEEQKRIDVIREGVERGLSNQTIAKQLGVSYEIMKKYKLMAGLPIRHRVTEFTTKKQKEFGPRVKELWEQGYTANAIYTMTGLESSTSASWAKKFGWERKGHIDGRRNRPKKSSPVDLEQVVEATTQPGRTKKGREFKSAQRVADHYGVSQFTAQRWMREGDLLENRVFVDDEEIGVLFEELDSDYLVAEKLGLTLESVRSSLVRSGLLTRSQMSSRYEEELAEIFKSWNIPFTRQARIYGDNRSADFYFPEHNVAVEFNGLYWHSTDFRKSGYHLKKTQAARENGIRLIHVWEHLWRDPQKKKVYANMIRHALGLTEHRVGARKTRVEKRPAVSMKKFFLENNIQGYRSARDAYVLVDKKTGEDLMCYTTGHAHFGKGKYDLEIARGACKLGYHVPGGATKLWKAILEDQDVNSIVYYVDLNHYNGASVGVLPGSKLIVEQSGFWNWWLSDDTVRNREPQRHKEIKQGYGDGSVKMIDNAGTATYVWER